MADRLAIVVLAAGVGSRMRSDTPKVLHRAAGRPLLQHVLRAAAALEPERVVVVTGHGADAVEAALGAEGVSFVRQDRQLGTAHAFLQARASLEDWTGDVLVLYGDTPLLRAETLEQVLREHRASRAGMTVITADLEDPTGYGRIIRAQDGQVLRIVEEKAASLAEKAVRETNSGVYVFDDRAFALASSIGNDNPAREYYLTDVLERYRQAGAHVRAHKVADASELMGVNDRKQLAFAERVLRDRVRDRAMIGGVTLLDPGSTFIDDTVHLEPDVTVYPGAFLEGETRVARGAVIGANAQLRDAIVDAHAVVHAFTVIDGGRVGAGASAGPFARLRQGANLDADAHVGNFVEVKNASLGRGVKAGHLAYLGDAVIGDESNIGAGTIIANYDGVQKFRTRIGAGAFIGSNSTLIAPRDVGDAAFVAAGSTVHEDVPAGALAVARGKQRNVEGWAERYWAGALKRARDGSLGVIRAWLASRRAEREAPGAGGD